jgi:pyruvate,water dikinase
MICFFRDLTRAEARLAGGKGSALARLSQAGYPVPNGFVVLASAFEGDALAPRAWEEVRRALARMRADQPGSTFAVRSSALAEDSADASFAGEFETVLDVRDDEGVRRAIDAVRTSRNALRVAAYSQAQGLPSAHEVAVVVQRMVAADFAGVLFTADPVTGSRRTMVGNFVRGLGERLVSGEATAPTFTLGRPRGDYTGPPELRGFARKIYRLGAGIEKDLGAPQDIEWAIAQGELVLLQARPITTLRGDDPKTGAWNDSLTGDYLWTSTNLGEAVPDVMTPCTWSLLQLFMSEALRVASFDGYSAMGNIGGRFYMNLSMIASFAALFGFQGQRFGDMIEDVFGRIPDDMEIPLIPFQRFDVLRRLLPLSIRLRWRARGERAEMPAFLASAPAQCDALHARIAAAESGAALVDLWHAEVDPYFRKCCHMLRAGAAPLENARPLRRDLRALVGEPDAGTLLSGLSAGASKLASLGPLLGLAELGRGEIDRPTYARRYGHRSPHEFEVSIARPAEDPGWIDRQLASLQKAEVDAPALLRRQQEAHAAAWERLRQRHPRKAAAMRRRIEALGAVARDREAARSEVVRALWVLRAYFLRAGALTGVGEDIFFLTIEEILGLLAGEQAPLAHVPARRITHARYRALPAYPALIRGRFDPFQWAKDPRRRVDRFDPRGDGAPTEGAIKGFPGAAGVVEGRVRVLFGPDESDALETGEILVTVVTNVGWTPLFPRAAAIVTDVGAPLSHAAIVARELGIPAVVGCGNATMRLRTGDRVRVNGALGTVEVLQAAS